MNQKQHTRKRNKEDEPTGLKLNNSKREPWEEPLQTTREISRALKVTERTVQNLVARGEIEAIKIGRCVRFRQSDVFRSLGIHK